MHVPSNVIYRATVIGAGPSGLACIGNLLDLLPPTSKILWIDPHFTAGRLSAYPAVPSNTKVCLFTKYAEECESFGAERRSETFRKLRDEFEGQKGCKLRWAADLCKELSDQVKGYDNVYTVKSIVSELEYRKDSKVWIIKTNTGEVLQSNLVFLTTGSQPKSLDIAGEAVYLDDALNPDILNQRICPSDTIAVYGSSHSAMLVLMNLLSIPRAPKLIVNYYRHPSKFATFPDPIARPDLILHDNTGLKGDVAEWVRSWDELGVEELTAKFSGKLKRIQTTADKHEVVQVDKNIFAVGYERTPLPKIAYYTSHIDPIDLDLDYTPLGQLTFHSQPIDGLYGFGIAFPERVKDLDGEDEGAVGLWKFMRHIKKSLTSIMRSQ